MGESERALNGGDVHPEEFCCHGHGGCAHAEHAHEGHHSHGGIEHWSAKLAPEASGIFVESHLHDSARVVSGRALATGSYEKVRGELMGQLESIARAVWEMGGVVGHIKASCEVKSVEVFSVTEGEVSVRGAPEEEIAVSLVAIVFNVGGEEAEALVRTALEAATTAATEAMH